jgi:hypothetical protein
MACSLSSSTSGKERYVGPIDATVTLKLQSPAGVGAKILQIRYGKDPLDSTPPLQFKIARGRKILVILVEASKPGALLQLVEVCGSGDEQVIDSFHFDPFGPARGYLVAGA